MINSTLNRFLGLLATTLILGFGSVSAQTFTEDVVYLKDGSFYRGVIMEMVPDSFLIIMTSVGNRYDLRMSDVERIAKEAIDPIRLKRLERWNDKRKRAVPDSLRPRFEYREKCYFFQAQLNTGVLKAGVMFVNGYRFSKMVHLGLAVGIETILQSGVNNDISGIEGNNYDGPVIPLLLALQGDFFKKRATPFYYVEAGYGITFSGSGLPFGTSQYRNGGFGGGFGFGVKFSSVRLVKMTLSVGLDIRSIRHQWRDYDAGAWRTYTETDAMFFPTIRMSVGI